MAIFTAPAEPLTLPADAQAVLCEGLEDALSMLRADRGNVQIVDPVSGSLRIAAQAGFSDEFLEYFAVVNDDDSSACGIAARQHAQTVISDVNTDVTSPNGTWLGSKGSKVKATARSPPSLRARRSNSPGPKVVFVPGAG